MPIRTPKLSSLPGRFACIAFLAFAVVAAPVPSVTFYGMLVDEFGWPYEMNVRVEIHAQGESIFEKSIAPAQGRDYNFLIRIPYDSGTSPNVYSPNALVNGEVVDLKIIALESRAILIQTNFVVAFAPGAVLNINLTAGTDSLGDGIPDELRRWIWLNTGGSGLFDPRLIRAGDDSDFDGITNLDEYLAGTDPANFEDVLQLEAAASGVPNVGKITFYTVPGKTYQVQASDLASTPWTVTAFANSPSGAATYTKFVGTGHFVSLFLPNHDQRKFYRILVEARKGASLVP